MLDDNDRLDLIATFLINVIRVRNNDLNTAIKVNDVNDVTGGALC